MRNYLITTANLFFGLGYEVIIEGIGDEDTHDFVSAISPNIVCQGFHYARPMPIENTLDLIKKSF